MDVEITYYVQTQDGEMELEIEAEVSFGQAATYHQPGDPDDVQIVRVRDEGGAEWAGWESLDETTKRQIEDACIERANEDMADYYDDCADGEDEYQDDSYGL